MTEIATSLPTLSAGVALLPGRTNPLSCKHLQFSNGRIRFPVADIWSTYRQGATESKIRRPIGEVRPFSH